MISMTRKTGTFILAGFVLIGLYQNCTSGFEVAKVTDNLQLSSQSGGNISAAASCTNDPMVVAGSQRLTKTEYNNVIRDLFNIQGDFSSSFTEDAKGLSGFTTESSAQNLSPDIVRDFYDGATKVVNALFAMNPNPLLSCTSGDACATKLITELATKAYRRPPSADEINSLMTVFKASSDKNFAPSLKLVVMTVLMSPQFIFRHYDLPASTADVVDLSGYELASRLSFFLWGSIPDSALLGDAASGSLKNPATLEAQVRRMMKDPRISYLASSFGSQWLQLDHFDSTILDTKRFPAWNAAIKNSMKNEPLNFVKSVFANDRSVMDFVSARYSFVDQNLSQIYGLGGVTSSQFVQVNLDSNHVGLLTQPAILAMNSAGDHTVPVRRGKWVLENILCSAPGAPPPNIPMLPPVAGGDLQGESNIRARLEQHRTQGASCMACHSSMDPIGLTFENFDSMGYYRTRYQDGVAIDASGQLPSGEKMNNVMDLAQVLQKDRRFPACFTAKLTSFAQGRDATTGTDRCSMQAIAAASAGEGKKFSDLVVQIVLDKNFRRRKVTR
jgi:hypothetical protein